MKSFNLDPFFTDREQTKSLLLADAIEAKEDACALMEGVMGLYDGIGGVCLHGSSYELADWTDTPVLLIIDAKGAGRSLLAVVKGLQAMDEKKRIRGILLNRITGAFYPRMKELIETECQLPVAGYLPDMPELAVQSRYLGLLLPRELQDIADRIEAAAKQAEKTIDLEAVVSVMQSAGELAARAAEDKAARGQAAFQTDRPVLAVAEDEAFCFYYRENLRLLEQVGFVIKPFSPISDDALPEKTAGLLLGGGYPENHALSLSRNRTMREAIRQAVMDGMPVIAECGGFLYLHDVLEDEEGNRYPMCGVVPAKAVYQRRSVRFGYITIEEMHMDGWFAGACLRGHEFHHYESERPGSDLRAVRPYDGSSYRTGYVRDGQYYGFPHLYLPSAPSFVQAFYRKALTYGNAQ